MGLAIVGAAAPAHAAKFSERLGRAVVPTFQSIELKLDPAQAEYSGSTRIELEVREPTDAIRFHSEGQRLHPVRLVHEGVELEVSQGAIADDVVEVTVPEPLSPGRYVLTIGFDHEFGTQPKGLYRAEHAGDAYAFTQFEADDAREAFPGWDEPGFKIPFQLTLTVPDGTMAISNTEVEAESAGDGWRTTTFRTTRPLPTYLLAIAVGPFDTVPIPGLSVPGRIVAPRGQSHLAGAAQEVTGPILAAMEEYFDRSHPYEKLDLIAVPEFWPGAMENPGAITFRDAVLLLDPDATTAEQRRRLVRITAHELAHQWFGNLVTMEWWDDLWLNEAFADWLGDKITHRVHPEFETPVRELRRTQGLLARDALPSTQPIRRVVEPGSLLMEGLGVTYQKGKLVLSMFEEWAGEEAFRRGVIDYLNAHADGNATADDLWNALDAATGRDVSGAMAAFLEQPGHPLVELEVEGRRVRVAQSRFHHAGADVEELSWKVPMVLRYSDGETLRTRRLLLDRESAVVELEADRDVEWVYPNAGAAGCYRWSLASDRMGILAARADRELTSIERVEFLGNLSGLLDAGAWRAVDYAKVVNRFAADEDLAVVPSAVAGLGNVRSAFVTEDLADDFAIFVRRTLWPALNRIGLERRSGESEIVASLRTQLVNWLGDYGSDPDVRAYARERTAAYLKDPTSVDPSIAGISLSLAALDGDRELFDTFRARFESAEVPTERSRFLSALGSFRDPVIVERALAYSLEGPLRSHEVLAIPWALRDTEPGRDRAFDWMVDHYDELAERLSPRRLAGLPSFGSGCSVERLDRMIEFFEDSARRVPGTERRIERVEDEVADCRRLREAEGPAVAAYLRSFAAGAGSTSLTRRSSLRRP
jgi:alanyl aminopeptidase